MKVTWLLQGGFLFEYNNHRMVIDAYLSNVVERTQGVTRLAENPVSLEELKPDSWICTHDHLDHLDPETVAKAALQYPDCVFVGPSSVCEHLEKLGVPKDRIGCLNVGDSAAVDDFEILAVTASHSDPDAIGIILKVGLKTVYLSGDTELTDDLVDDVEQFDDVDVMFVCINGRLGNMNAAEAVELVKIVNPVLVVPMHYGLFAENTADPKQFISRCAKSHLYANELTAGCEYDLETLMANQL